MVYAVPPQRPPASCASPASSDTLFFGTVAEKLAAAASLAVQFADIARKDAVTAPLLTRFQHHDELLRSAMRSSGMSACCAECGASSSGGCCGTWVANETDALLLLANHLLAGPATHEQGNSDSCGFLGTKGYSLVVKPFLCVNYDYEQLGARLNPVAHSEVRRERGAVLQCYLELENRLRTLVAAAPQT